MFLVFLFCLNQTHMYNGLWNNRRQRPLSPPHPRYPVLAIISIPQGIAFFHLTFVSLNPKLNPCILSEWCNCSCNRILSNAKNFTVLEVVFSLPLMLLASGWLCAVMCFAMWKLLADVQGHLFWQVVVLMDWTKQSFSHCCSNCYAQCKLLNVPLRQCLGTRGEHIKSCLAYLKKISTESRFIWSH